MWCDNVPARVNSSSQPSRNARPRIVKQYCNGSFRDHFNEQLPLIIFQGTVRATGRLDIINRKWTENRSRDERWLNASTRDRKQYRLLLVCLRERKAEDSSRPQKPTVHCREAMRPFTVHRSAGWLVFYGWSPSQFPFESLPSARDQRNT